MKKRKILFCLLSIIMAAACITANAAILYAKDNNYKTAEREVIEGMIACYAVFPDNLSDLEGYSEIILRGIILPDKEETTEHNEMTKTKLLVAQVIKGDGSLLGKIININEPYWLGESEGREVYYATNNYMPSIVGKQYIFFLGKSLKDDCYYIHFADYGKYCINDNAENYTDVDSEVDRLSNKEINVKETFQLNGTYRNIYKEIIKKYVSNDAEETASGSKKTVTSRVRIKSSDRIRNIDDLENKTSLTVKGFIMPQKEEFLSKNGSIKHTKTKVFVNEVLNGDESVAGTIIEVMEPYCIKKDKKTEGYFTFGNYEPSIVLGEYILFLDKYDGEDETYKDAYMIKYNEKGKYYINKEILEKGGAIDEAVRSMSNEDLNIGPDSAPFYRELYKEVIEEMLI